MADTSQATVFSCGSMDNREDMLSAAASVICFLKEVVPGLPETESNSGLSDNGAEGLYLILDGVEQTIRAVADLD